MKTTPLFSMDFHIKTLNKKKRTAGQRLVDELAKTKKRSLEQLSKCFEAVIPKQLLAQNDSGNHSRSRIFTKDTTFWAFFSQIVDADGGCSEVVSKIWAFFAIKGLSTLSPSTGAYCMARKNLAKAEVEAVFNHTATVLDDRELKDFSGRRVVVVDGTGLKASDTSENQA